MAEMGAQYNEGDCSANVLHSMASQEGLTKWQLNRPDPSRGLFCRSDGRVMDLPVSVMAFNTFRQIEQEAADLFSIGCGRDHGSLLHFMGARIQQELRSFSEEQRYDAARILHGLTNCVRCRCGDDLSLVSADTVGSYIEIPGGGVRVPLGYVGILAPLLRDLPNGAIRYCKPVQNILWGSLSNSGPRAIVKCSDGDEYRADLVLVTVSLGVLKTQAHKLFCPGLPANKMTAISKLGFSNANKIFLEYDCPFWAWRDKDIKLTWTPGKLAGREGWVRGLSSVEEMSDSQHVMCAWVQGQEAAEVERCSDEEVAQSVTRVLRQFTGDCKLPCPVKVLRSRWCSDPYFCGAYSYMGIESEVGHQQELGAPVPGTCDPIAPILLFAGEATCPGHYSTVHGARLSGIREAERIADLYRRLKSSSSQYCMT